MTDYSRYFTAPPTKPTATPDYSRYFTNSAESEAERLRREEEERKKKEEEERRIARERQAARVAAMEADAAAKGLDVRDRTLGDHYRRIEAAALNQFSGVPDFKEAAVRGYGALSRTPVARAMNLPILSEWMEEPVVSGLTGFDRAALAKAEEITGRPFTTASQQRVRDEYRSRTGSDLNPYLDAALDTQAEVVGILMDPTNLIPGAAAPELASQVVRAAAARADTVAPLAGRAIRALDTHIPDLMRRAPVEAPPPAAIVGPEAGALPELDLDAIAYRDPLGGILGGDEAGLGRPEVPGAAPVSGAGDQSLRDGLRAGEAPRPLVTGAGSVVPLPGGPVFRGEATGPDVAAQAGGLSHLAGRHFTEARAYAQLHADKYGANGRVVETQLDVQRPFSVEADYDAADLSAFDPSVVARVTAEVGEGPIPGRLVVKALEDSYLERAGAGRLTADGVPDLDSIADAILYAGDAVRGAGFDSYHHRVRLPTGERANAWADLRPEPSRLAPPVVPRETLPPPAALPTTTGPYARPDVPYTAPEGPTARKLGPEDGLPFEFNLARYNVPQEVADGTLDAIKQNLDEIMEHRRDVQSWDKWKGEGIQRIAADLGYVGEQGVQRFLRTRKGTAFNDDQLAVLAATKGAIDNKVQALVNKQKTGEFSAVDRAELARLLDQQTGLLKVAIGRHSEAGRALNSAKAFQAAFAGTPSESFRMALLRAYGDSISDETLAKAALLETPEQVTGFMRSLRTPGPMQRVRGLVNTAWTAFALSGIPTQERNVLGGILETGGEMLNRIVQPAVDSALSRFTGKRTVYAGEAGPAARGAVHGARVGMGKFFRILKHNYDPESAMSPEDIVTQWDRAYDAFHRDPNPVVRAVGVPITASLRLMRAMDAFTYATNFGSEQYAAATRLGVGRGLKGQALADFALENLQNPKVLEAARSFAEKVTYRDEMSGFGKGVTQARDWLGKKAPVLRSLPIDLAYITTPFIKIADRVMDSGLKWTPGVGHLRGLSALADGDQRKAGELLAKSTVGLLATSAAWMHAREGGMIAWAPTDPEERERFFREGNQEWSMKLNGEVIPFGQMEPFATPLALVAAMSQAMDEYGHEPTSELVLRAVMAMGQRQLNASYMEAPAALMDAFSGDHGAASRFKSLAANLAAPLIPFSALLRGLALAEDPRVVKPETIPDRIAAMMPSWLPGKGRVDLPSEPDVWGNDMEMVGGEKRLWAATQTPLMATEQTVDPLDAEMERIGLDINRASASFDGMTLRPQEHREWRAARGQARRAEMQRLISSPGYRNAPPEKQLEWAEDVRDRADERAREEFRASHKGLFDGLARAKRSTATVASTARSILAARRAGTTQVRQTGGVSQVGVAGVIEARRRAAQFTQEEFERGRKEMAEARIQLRQAGYTDREIRHWLIASLSKGGGLSKADAARLVDGDAL